MEPALPSIPFDVPQSGMGVWNGLDGRASGWGGV